MAKKLILENLMKLAQGIGANPSKFMGTKTNISFLGKGPTRNPLFQRPVPGLEEHITSMTLQGQRGAALDKSMITAVEDAMGFATAGKLNDIQLQALTINLQSLSKGLNPPKLPSAKIMTLPQRGEGIGSLKGVDPRDTILPMQRSTFKSALPEPGPFMGWKPKVVPKAHNIPASKINHQIIADKYGIDVELIRGKDWIEVLEVIKNLGLRHGGLARILEV